MSYKHEVASYATGALADQNFGGGDSEFLDPQVALAYAAGFIDGEGCIHIAKQQQPRRPRPTYRARLTVAQSHREALERLRDILGAPSYLGKVRRTVQQNRQAYVLVYDGRHAGEVLAKVLPHLFIKAIEAQVLLEYFEVCDVRVHPGPKGHDAGIWKAREYYYKKLQRLK